MNSPFNGNFRVTQIYHSGHSGLDIVGLTDKQIHATVNGYVQYAGWENVNNKKQGFGQYVCIRDYISGDYYYYGHMSELKCRTGDSVKIGQVIGIEGSTGYSTGSHCHYEVRSGLGTQYKWTRNVSVISGIPNQLGVYNERITPTNKINVIYQACTDIWLPEVVNLNYTDDNGYAGIIGKSITALRCKLSEGDIFYSVHTIDFNKWHGEVKNYERDSYGDDFAGLIGHSIDGVKIRTNKGQVRYRVGLQNDIWLPFVTGCDESNHLNGYAGILGRKIDRIQIEIM